MHRAKTSVLAAIFTAILAPSARAQGISEMGGAYAGSSVLSGAARRGSVGSGVNNAFGALEMQMTAGVGAPKGAGGAGGAGVGAINWPSSAATVQSVAKASNKAYNMAVQKEKAGKLAEAVTFYGQAVAYRQNIWGYKDPAVASILMKMGDLDTKMGKHKEASTCYERCVAAAVKRFGQGEFALCPYLVKVAESLYAQKDYKGAYNYMNQVYMLRLRKLGEDDKSTITAATVLAKICMDAGSYGEASELIGKSLESRERLNDSASPEYLGLLDDYVNVLKLQKQEAKAAEFEEKANALRAKLGVQETKSADAPAADKEVGEKKPDSAGAGAVKSAAGGAASEKAAGSSNEGPGASADKDKKGGSDETSAKSRVDQSTMTKSKAPNGMGTAPEH